jgi:hypothetical protein
MSKKTRNPIHRCECLECQCHPRGETAKLHRSINRVMAELDEKSRRLVAGLWAIHIGRGGIQRLAEITGLSRPTIARGQGEAKQTQTDTVGRIRRSGAGRPRVEKNSRIF